MIKKLFTYLCIVALNIPVILPICLSYFEQNCKVSLMIDLDEEIEDIEKTSDTETKILVSDADLLLNYLYAANKNKIVFIAKKYNSLFQNLDSPPPQRYS